MKIYSQKLILKHLFSLFFIICFGTLSLAILIMYAETSSHLFSLSDFLPAIKECKSKLSLFFFFSTLITLQILLYHSGKMRLFMIFLTSGVGKRKLIAPFYLFGGCLCLILTANYFLTTESLRSSRKKTRTKHLLYSDHPVFVKKLDNGETLIFNREGSHVFDLFWLKADQTIVYASDITTNNSSVSAVSVQEYTKDLTGKYYLATVLDSHILPFNLNDYVEPVRDITKGSTHRLIKMIRNYDAMTNPIDLWKLKTELYYRIATPLYPFLLITFFLPFFFRLDFPKQSASLYIQSLLFFIFSVSWMQLAIACGELHLFSPLLTLILIPLVLQALLFYRLYKAI